MSRVLMWRLEHRKRTKEGEYKTTKKPISREEAIGRLLKDGGYLQNDDGTYYKKETETITLSESELLGSYDVILEDGDLKVVPTIGLAEGVKNTTIGIEIDLQGVVEDSEKGPTEKIPILIVFEDGLEE